MKKTCQFLLLSMVISGIFHNYAVGMEEEQPPTIKHKPTIYTNMVFEGLSGIAHSARLATLNCKSATKIRIASVLAILSTLAAGGCNAYVIGSGKAPSTPSIGLHYILELLSSLRVLRHAKKIALLNSTTDKKHIAETSALIALTGTSKTSKLYRLYEKGTKPKISELLKKLNEDITNSKAFQPTTSLTFDFNDQDGQKALDDLMGFIDSSLSFYKQIKPSTLGLLCTISNRGSYLTEFIAELVFVSNLLKKAKKIEPNKDIDNVLRRKRI